MPSILKYAVDITTKEEGWLIINRSHSTGRIDYIFIPNNDKLGAMQRINFLKKGVEFTSENAKTIEPYKLAIYYTSLFEKAEEGHYIKFNQMIVGDSPEERDDFFIIHQKSITAF